MQGAIYLNHPPRILRLDRSTHGRRRKETFLIREYWVMHLYHYDATFVLRDLSLSIQPGMVTLTPPGERTIYQFPNPHCEHYYVFFEPESGSATEPVKLVYSPNEITSGFAVDFRLAIRVFHDRPDQSRAIIWNLLWTLANLSAPQVEARGLDTGSSIHPAVRKAQRIIQMDLRRSLKVNQIARDCRISHNQLTRLFREFTGMTVTGYIQQQRTKQAEYLLRNSTLPVKMIAQECGIPDLHYFNKVIKARFGVPPSRMR
jgi:AraC-like DNA-binding protein